MSTSRMARVAAALWLAWMPGTFAQDPAPPATPPKAPTASELRAAVDRHLREGSFAEAEAAARQMLKLDGEDAWAWMQLGITLHYQGKLEEALRAHLKAAELGDPAEASVGAYNAACVYSLTKRPDEAFQWLDKALQLGMRNAHQQLAGDTDMDNIRQDPRFQALLERAKGGGAAQRGADAGSLPAGQQAYAGTSKRMGTRIVFFGETPTGDIRSAGQVAIDYGVPEWKAEYEEQAESKEFVDRRWRLGQDFWTILDTSIPVSIGSARLEPGSYYMTLEKQADGRFLLVFLDPAEVRKQKLDPFVAERTQGGIETEVKHEAAATPAEELEIKLESAGRSSAKGTLTIRFGPHQLTAPVTCHLAP